MDRIYLTVPVMVDAEVVVERDPNINEWEIKNVFIDGQRDGYDVDNVNITEMVTFDKQLDARIDAIIEREWKKDGDS